MDGIRSGKVFLVLMDDQTGVNTTKRISDSCSFRKVSLMTYDASVEDAAAACGKSVKVIGVTDKNFAKMLLNLKGVSSTGVEI